MSTALVRIFRFPDSIPIVTTQMRPAEKLQEELSVDGALDQVPGVPGLLIDPEPRVDSRLVRRLLRRLLWPSRVPHTRRKAYHRCNQHLAPPLVRGETRSGRTSLR